VFTVYHAESWTSKTIPESYGIRAAATTTENAANPITYATGSGNGASGSIAYITGNTAATVSFPPGSIPSTFTVCSITRYTGGTSGRILQGTSTNFLHGHHGAVTGVAHYNAWKTQEVYNEGRKTDWLVMCGSNGGSTPGNIKIAFNDQGYAIRNVGTGTGGTGNDAMKINTGYSTGQTSDFGSFRSCTSGTSRCRSLTWIRSCTP